MEQKELEEQKSAKEQTVEWQALLILAQSWERASLAL
jgi:hypothetical protein